MPEDSLSSPGDKPLIADGPAGGTQDGSDALAETSRRFDAILDNTKMAVFMMNDRQQCVFMNRAAEELTGYRFAETQGRPLHDVIHHTRPDGSPYPLAECPIDRAFPEEHQVEGEETFVHKDGHFYRVGFTASPIISAAGKPIGTVIEARNLAGEIERESALRESEQRFRTVFENAGVGMVEVDPDWRVLGANPAYAAITGRSLEELAGESCLLFTHPQDVERSLEALHTVRSGEAAGVTFEKRYLRKDGEIVWVRSNLAMIGSDGTRFLKIVEDISDAREAQEALNEERHNLETLNRVGSAIASELDLERVVQLVTDAGVELTGAHFGAFFYNVTRPDGDAYMLYTLSGAERSQFDRFGMPRATKVFSPTFEGEGIVRSDDITQDARYGHNPPHQGMPKGHLPVVSYLALPVTSRSGEVIGGLFFGHPDRGRFKERHERLMEGIAAQAAIAIDNARLYRAAQYEIDQRVKAEQALTALNETLESRVAEEIDRRSRAEEVLRQAQKMETVGQLSGGIAHDFNNLLQIIHGNLSLLQHSIPATEQKWRRSLANALTGTERAAALTQRLLAFSRRQPLDPKPVDVNWLINDMTELLHRTLGETIIIDTNLSPGIPNALVDANQLENALLNLAINARDAMPSGGRLDICTELAELDLGYSELQPDAEPGRYVRIVVRDTGEGMNADVLSRAVEPFFSTKEVGQGTGLGLSMVYGFAKQSGGHLVLQSSEGTGTTVELFLPSSDAAAQPRGGRQMLPELALGRGERVLLCEDDDDVRLFSGETLRDLGYNVIEARDAGEALALLGQSGRIDLLFTDIVLPGGKTGADLAREARKLQPDLKVLFTTGYARSALEKEPRAQQGVDLLLKPFGVDELAARIREMLD